jgi:hypothetical protein
MLRDKTTVDRLVHGRRSLGLLGLEIPLGCLGV